MNLRYWKVRNLCATDVTQTYPSKNLYDLLQADNILLKTYSDKPNNLLSKVNGNVSVLIATYK